MNNYLDNFYNNWILDNSADKYLLEDQYPLQEDKFQRVDNQYSTSTSKYNLIKYYLVKYRRIIGVVLLILLFYITPSISIYSSNDSQTGGGYVSAVKKYSGYDALTAPKVEEVYNERGKVIQEGKKGGLLTRMKSGMEAGNKIADKDAIAKTRGALKHTFRAGKDAVKYGADVYSSYSDMIFAILYQIAFVIIICIIFVPSLTFVVGGIVCFTLLKRRVNYLKSL